MLEAEHLTKTFGGPAGKTVFKNLNLSLTAQECVLIVGPKGTGKSTLLNLLGGLIRADSGQIRIAGTALELMNDAELANFRRQRIGFIFQSFHLLPHLSAGLNIALPLQLDGLSRSDALKRARELLATIDLADAMDALPGDLTTHQAQRVAVARALAHRPKLILADEPAKGLEPADSQVLVDFLKKELKRLEASAIIMSEDRSLAQFVDRTLCLTSGTLSSFKPESSVDIPAMV